ncbi:MAG TPA: hypothetical protein VJV05_15060 [Pyrinomonadaceae bacterium]|nr:hypothetical protein [Pyrinomonadaceae bacterium]
MADGERKSGLMSVFDATAKVLTPIMIFAVGTYYTWTKDAAEREQSALDRCYGYAKDLAKAGVAEQKMLLSFIQLQCSEREELRAATLPQVVETATASKDEEIRNTAKETAQVVAASANTSVVNKVEAALTTVTRNIYIHIADDAQREQAESLKLRLSDVLANDGAAYSMPGIEVVGNDRSPSAPQVRYFRQEDAPEAQRIATLLADLGLANAQAAQVRGSARPFQLEIWFAKRKVTPAAGPATTYSP